MQKTRTMQESHQLNSKKTRGWILFKKKDQSRSWRKGMVLITLRAAYTIKKKPVSKKRAFHFAKRGSDNLRWFGGKSQGIKGGQVEL